MYKDQTVFWLKAASATLIGFGVVFALSMFPVAQDVTLLFVDLVLWPIDGVQRLSAAETRLFCAISGGLTAGLGVMIWQMVSHLYPREPEMARTIILSGVGAWFVVDSTGSILAGAPGNALLNVVFLLMFVGPLWKSKRKSTAIGTR